ncbi:MAG: hypothetical protein GF393_03270 [Armatimonadia bacterium]|nr:hypothetical protein [Armatimonadia bacterium]
MPEDEPREPDNGETNGASAEVAEEAPGEPTLTPTPPEKIALDDYPLREKGEDPGWAVKIVKVWLLIAVTSLLFIIGVLAYWRYVWPGAE